MTRPRLRGEALGFASGEREQLTLVLLALLEDGVEVAGEHLRNVAPRSEHAGLMFQTRVVATARGSPLIASTPHPD
jgi:hypothetical protein